ncbi:AbrB/MazE/SpoVT family DNA-binding domain-containing protein [Accumulibacter sp.]|uniref:AbrB/MazE/SpoVT family DNA-binding domain-containing protein n=1 Tax=Accumulibacter sp. TaxID=2053492 RepID=UPI0025FF324F|nr:AbrB/MazE/SpoVT family DNA-binding domain-containing protein [Accumulibacter sp.]MCM8612735.1 AbrB/MazE/SpoVT family DNA-binding domain-containing protein [Accumulibacter sp.]MCM8637641.1 AbrB/MazE/SpoVT family DNA-binding domain-containing protein [Accumulibacter sp.]MCM8639668.1 AbrB/MazE/SpoVT family DNA-binding domain-containing protein [Accumulibacter sp.]
MRSTITARGQTVVPAEIRRQFHLSPADRLEWVVDSQGIRVVPVRANPIAAFRGQGKGGSTQRLVQDRNAELAGE